MTKYTKLTKYSQLKDGLKVRCKIGGTESIAEVEDYNHPQKAANRDFILNPGAYKANIRILRDQNDNIIFGYTTTVTNLELIEEVEDEPEKPIKYIIKTNTKFYSLYTLDNIDKKLQKLCKQQQPSYVNHNGSIIFYNPKEDATSSDLYLAWALSKPSACRPEHLQNLQGHKYSGNIANESDVEESLENPTIQPNQWYTPQEILEYVKADRRPNGEKRFKLLLTGNLVKNEEINLTLSDLIGNGIDVFSKEVKMQFLYWCDENWEEITEKANNEEENHRVEETDFLNIK